MSIRGISGVVLGYFHLDGGAARAWMGKVSLFSDFIRGRPTAFLLAIYKACSLYIVCKNARSSCVDSTFVCISRIVREVCISRIVREVCTSRIVREVAISRIVREVASSRIVRRVSGGAGRFG